MPQEEPAYPIFIDLDGDGVSLVSYSNSNFLFDFDGDGNDDRSTWVDAGDGVLFLDLGNDGLLTRRDEVAFHVLAGTATDLEALATLDSNGDGVFSAADDAFVAFKIWSDANGDGLSSASEIRGLGEMGITSIDLHLNGEAFAVDGARVNNTTTVLFSDGRSLAAWDTDIRTVDVMTHGDGWSV